MTSLWIPGVEFEFGPKRKRSTARLPAPKGNSPRVTRMGPRYSVRPSAKAEAAAAALAEVIPEPQGAPLTGAVRVEVVYHFEPAKSWPKWRQEAARRGLVVCQEHNRGDLDQLSKLLLDGLEAAGYFADDCQVTELVASKRYSGAQGYQVRIVDLGHGLVTCREYRALCAKEEGA